MFRFRSALGCICALVTVNGCQSSTFDDDTAVGDEDTSGGGGGDYGEVPVADAGDTQWVGVGEAAVLDGSSSADPEGLALTFLWSLVGTPAGSAASLLNETTAHPSFVADQPGTYTAALEVGDGGQTASDTVHVNAEIEGDDDTGPGPNEVPVADAGSDQVVVTGVQVALDGTQSTDPDGDDLSFLWAFTAWSGDLPSFDAPYGSTTQTPRFTPEVAGVYVLQLVVDDGITGTASDTVTVEVNAGETDDGCGCGGTAYTPGRPPLGGLQLDASGPHRTSMAPARVALLGLLVAVGIRRRAARRIQSANSSRIRSL